MITGQIITLSIICLLALISYITCILTNRNSEKNALVSILFILFILMTFVSYLVTLEMNSLRDNKNKCPEYEKIENVYKLKE
jgi:amino acid permease